MPEGGSKGGIAPSAAEKYEETRFFHLYDEASRTIRRTMIAMITFGFFCVLTLGTSDGALVSNASTLTSPFADSDVTRAGRSPRWLSARAS